MYYLSENRRVPYLESTEGLVQERLKVRVRQRLARADLLIRRVMTDPRLHADPPP